MKADLFVETYLQRVLKEDATVTIESLVKKSNEMHSQLCKAIFDGIVLPVLKKNNWSMDWDTAGVMFYDSEDNELDDYSNEEIKSIISSCDGIMDDSQFDYNNDSLLHIMGTIKSTGTYYLDKGIVDYSN